MNLSDLVNEDCDPREFVLKFIEVFNAPKATLNKLRKGIQNKTDIEGDLLWQYKLYFRAVEQGQAVLCILIGKREIIYSI